MSKSDRIKEEIGWLKVAFGIATALGASIVAWLAQNYATAEVVLVICGLVSTVVIALFVVLLHRRVYAYLEELENM